MGLSLLHLLICLLSTRMFSYSKYLAFLNQICFIMIEHLINNIIHVPYWFYTMSKIVLYFLCNHGFFPYIHNIEKLIVLRPFAQRIN